MGDKMEKQIIFLAGIKKQKFLLFGIAFLLFLTTLCLCTVLIIYLKGSRYISEEIQRAGFGDLTAWVSNVEDMDSLTESITRQDGVAGVEIQSILFTEYEGNGVKSDSEGQLILWTPKEEGYRFFEDDLLKHRQAPLEISSNEVYISPSIVSTMGIQRGDVITFPVARNGQNVILTVAGYYEDPFMGSSMIGMKGFLISQPLYEEIGQIIEREGMDALARKGAMIHITMDPLSSITLSELNKRLNENTSLSQYSQFVHSKQTMESFMVILQNAFCGLFGAFAVILLLTAFVVLGHSISGMLEQDWKNLGILKSIGFTGRKLLFLLMMEYGISVAGGLIFGTLAAFAGAEVVSRKMVTTCGVLIPVSLPIGVCTGVLAVLFFLFMGFIRIKLGRIYHMTPMAAIREEEGEKIGRDRWKIHSKIKVIPAKGLMFHLAVRQICWGKRRYVSTCITAALLVFFASLTGRMNSWLGPDGKGMRDAFNPADLDLGVQVMGERSIEDIEQVVRYYSDIIDSYMLAMPEISINGSGYRANVITDPERFHISRGQTSKNPDEVVLTEVAASDLGVDIGEHVMIRGNEGIKEFIVSGIYHCANDMGANLGMSKEGYLSIGYEDPKIWCYHYFLEDVSKKEFIKETLENTFGGDVHVHENTWPGLFGIIGVMKILLVFMYVMSAVFIFIVTVMAGSKILEVEQKELGIYKSIGCSTGLLRITFALRFGMVGCIGAVIGCIGASIFTDPVVSVLMTLAGISNFASHPDMGNVLFPGLIITLLFLIFAYFASFKVRKGNIDILTAE